MEGDIYIYYSEFCPKNNKSVPHTGNCSSDKIFLHHVFLDQIYCTTYQKLSSKNCIACKSISKFKDGPKSGIENPTGYWEGK